MTCAMQEQKHHHPHTHTQSSRLETIRVEQVNEAIRVEEHEFSNQRDALRYQRRKKIALITLVTVLAGTATAVIVAYNK